MDIPYKKILIYILTFVAYAYTGVGSNILRNLKDAVLSAESVFGDMFRNVITVAEKFRSLHDVFDAAVEEDCIFTCPGGQKPVRNRNHIPKSDGCGSLGFDISTEYLPIEEMTKCCDAHDICYDTCNSGKEICDLEFKRCLYNYCETYKSVNIGGETISKGCKGAAKLLFTGTLTLGCKSYLDAQKNACYCPPTKNKYKKYTTGDGEL
ncbi:PREDICTED: group XIIA secretory phospholipase A2 [Papilio xuthus]|uniref:Group XIIA secretory phospholipase A2 n=1 Tax=Papilio xuthus TaxID=66420 RepID=A0AAJ6ZWB6_PAPXU|nr:PREDICTED: group XIIA secretory phospholipase A2 [Papilio xuthus]